MMRKRYSDKDLSIVVQGAIDQKYTKDCLQYCRHHYPNAELILSTWDGSYLDCLTYDKVILNAASFNNEYHEGTYYGPTTDDALRIIHLYVAGHNNKCVARFAKYDINLKWNYLNRYVKKYNLGRLVLQAE